MSNGKGHETAVDIPSVVEELNEAVSEIKEERARRRAIIEEWARRINIATEQIRKLEKEGRG